MVDITLVSLITPAFSELFLIFFLETRYKVGGGVTCITGSIREQHQGVMGEIYVGIMRSHTALVEGGKITFPLTLENI